MMKARLRWGRVGWGWLAALLAALALSTPVWAQSAAGDEIRFEDYALEVTDYYLENGLRVILAQDMSAPVVAVNLWYRVGGANDPAGRSGFAHLFEHMMFEGTANIPDGGWDLLLEPIGARNNAYTAPDTTAYWELAPAHELPRILWMEADRMRSLQVDERAYETQRAVVIQEYNERVANAPYGVANTRLFSQPMRGYPPYARPVIGSVEDLNAAPFAEVEAFHDLYYKPNNAVLVVVGDIDIAQAQALIQAHFGDIPAGEPVAPIYGQYAAPAPTAVRTDEATGCLVGTEEVIIDPQIRVPRWGMTVLTPPWGTPDYYAVSLLVSILSGGDASRMERNIVQQGKAAAAFVGMNPYLTTTVVYGVAFPNSGVTLEELAGLMLDEIASVRAEGVTEAELARVKRQLVVGTLTSYRDSALDTSEWLQDATLTFGSPDTIVQELEMFEAVTTADVQRVAEQYLCQSPMNFQQALPSGEPVLVEEDSAAYPTVVQEWTPPTITPLILAESDLAALPAGTTSRSEVPAPLGEPVTNFPPFVSFTLDNGLDVIFVEQRELPKVQLQLVVGGADAAAPADVHGVAEMMATLITKGTVKRSAVGIAEAIESVGGSLTASAALEWTTISVDALTTDSKLAFDLLGEVARYATFPQAEFDVAQAQTLTFLEADANDPNSMANRQFGRLAFGGHPYGNITTPATIGGLTRADVRAFHRTYYRPNNALLIIVGDLTEAEARAHVQRAFGPWRPAEVPDFLAYPERQPVDTSVIYLVDRPGSEQATIQVGNIAIDARNPDRYALEVVNSALGSGASSRLFRNLREDKGYTYGVYSRFARPNDEATFRVLGDFNMETAAAAIQEILAELARIRDEAIPAQELADAKGKIIGGFALALEDPNTFAGQLAIRALTGVPIEELNGYLPALEAVTAEEAQAAAQAYIDVEAPIIVVVGDAAALEAQLATIKPVVVVDADGNVIEE